MSCSCNLITGFKAKLYNWHQTLNGSGRLYSKMVELIELQSGDKLLDIGCGTGTVLFRLWHKFGNTVSLVGIDPSEDMIRIAIQKSEKVKANVSFNVSAGEKLPHEDKSFDWVITSLTLHHVSKETKRQIIDEAWRVLKPGGKFLICDFGKPKNTLGKLLAIMFRYHSHSLENLNGVVAKLLNESKFSKIQIIYPMYGLIDFIIVDNNRLNYHLDSSKIHQKI